MTTKNYTTKTAALRATIADVNKLETKKIKVNGKDVATSVKHPNDTREVITENDLWGSWAEITKDGEIVFHEDEVTNPNYSYGGQFRAWNNEITRVENNKGYIGDTLYANIQTENIQDGALMFYDCSNFTSFNGDLSSLTDGYDMFYYSNIESINNGYVNLHNLSSGYCMLAFSKLEEFDGNLDSLKEGEDMFQNTNIKEFNVELPSLTNGGDMFTNCRNLTTFTSDLSSLIHGYCMFDTCSNLTTFTSDLSSLINGTYMFDYCGKLTSFTSDLSSLISGFNMFIGCKLDTDSLLHIAETIRDIKSLKSQYTSGNMQYVTVNSEKEGFTSDGEYVFLFHRHDYAYGGTFLCRTNIYKEYVGKIHIGIGNSTPTEEEKELLTEIHNKGWQVFVNGSSSSNIFTPTALTPIDGEEVTTPIPYWAKPQEVDEEHAEYTDGNGKFYNIIGGNYIFVDDKETYGLFTSLEDAAANMRLTKIERN